MTDELQTLTSAEVDAAPVGTIVRTTKTKRCEVAIKIAPANRSTMGLWRTTNGTQFDFAIAHAGAVLMAPAATALSKDEGTTVDSAPSCAGLRTALTELARS